MFGSRYKAGDGLPVFTCGMAAGGARFVPQLIQQAGLDIANGFHLGLLPVGLNDSFALTDAQLAAMTREGSLDCHVTTLDAVALHGSGVPTLIVDESAGSSAIWARDIATPQALKGKRVAVERGGASEYFALRMLATWGMKPDKDVYLVRYAQLSEAVAAFNNGATDAVSGHEPAVLAALEGGGRPLVSTATDRAIVGVVATSPHSIERRADVVRRFHKAWFDALALQSRDFEQAARHVAEWGHAEWTGVNAANAAQDWRAQLRSVAQADARHNRAVFAKPERLVEGLRAAWAVWDASGAVPKTGPGALRVDGRFVAAEAIANELPPMTFPNMTFALGREPASAATPSALSPPLSCRRLLFDAEVAELLPESKRELDACVLTALRDDISLVVVLTGSAAWPGPKGLYTRQDVEDVARQRAQRVADYLIAQDIEPGRLQVEFTLPPLARRETEDASLQPADRFVDVREICGSR
jgi:ABC-type nitrate/sulfonate/bicarbonate transport system substrate-binding protein